MPILPLLLLLDPMKDMAKVGSVYYSADLKNVHSQTDDFEKFYKTGKMSYDMLRYIPGLSQIAYQGQIHSTEIKKKKKNVDDTYKNEKVIEFNIPLAANHYTNIQNMHICFPIKIKSALDNNNDIAAGVITVNNFFAQWIKELDIKSYGDDIPILPLINTFEKIV